MSLIKLLVVAMLHGHDVLMFDVSIIGLKLDIYIRSYALSVQDLSEIEVPNLDNGIYGLSVELYRTSNS